MRRKFYLPLILLLLSAQIALAQTIQIEKKDEISPELRKQAVAFLHETAADVGNLRTLENRISFSSEIANLMWLSDEKEARAMFQAIINDFRQLLAQYDSELNTAGENDSQQSGLSGRGNASRKMMKALGVRQQIAMSLAENDAPLALEFFNDSAQAVANPAFRKQIEQSDGYFESRLLAQLASQDIDTALKYGRKTLAKNFNYELLNVLKKVYEKDADKGAAFGEEIVQKIKSEDSKGEKIRHLSSVLSFGAENLEKLKGKPDKKPLFGEQTLREIADLLTKEVLKSDDAEDSGATRYAAQIEKFSPAGAMQIRQKFSVQKQTKTIMTRSGISAPPPPPAPRGVPIETESSAQKQLAENVQNLGAKQLSKEDREKIVGQARKFIAEIKDPSQKMLALSALALQIAALGDKEIAVQIMDEARNLTNLQPKNYMDFMQIWLLTSGYAKVDADKAFPILEDAILRLNDTISGFIKVGEFIDVGGEIIEDSEVQVGSFGGAMTRDLLGSLGATDTTVRSLATADFARTRDLTNKFDRSEVRLLAKMIVLRAVFGDKKETKED